MNFDASVLQVPIEDIIPNRFQPRLAFEDASLAELANSIKQHGIIQPLVLRKTGDKYEIIAGERRYKAAMMAGLTYVPAVVSNIDDKTSAEVAVAENVQRRDLTAIEEAKSYKALLDLGYMSQEQLAKKMGLSQSAIANKLRLLNLDPEVQNAILENKISERHARSLLTLKDPAEQREWLGKIIENRLTVRALDAELKKENKGGEKMNQKIDVEQEKQNATDITFNAPSMSNPTVGMGPIDLGEKPSGRFFNNNLEDQAVNMQMTAAINPLSQQMSLGSAADTKTEETLDEDDSSESGGSGDNNLMPMSSPASYNNENSDNSVEEIETLDVLDVPVSPVTVNNKSSEEAKNRIKELVSQLKRENFNIDLFEASNGNNVIFTITIKEEN